MKTAQYITTDGTISTISPKNGKDFKLEELKPLVDGYIQIVPLPGDKILICNEDGLSLGLSPNPKATEMVCRDAYLLPQGLLGNAIICHTSMVK